MFYKRCLKYMDEVEIEDRVFFTKPEAEVKAYANVVASKLTHLGNGFDKVKKDQEFSRFVGQTIAYTVVGIGAMYVIIYMILIKFIIWFYSMLLGIGG